MGLRSKKKKKKYTFYKHSIVIQSVLLIKDFYDFPSSENPKSKHTDADSSSDDTTLIIIAIVVPIVVITVVVIGLVLYCRKREFCLKKWFNVCDKL